MRHLIWVNTTLVVHPCAQLCCVHVRRAPYQWNKWSNERAQPVNCARRNSARSNFAPVAMRIAGQTLRTLFSISEISKPCYFVLLHLHVQKTKAVAAFGSHWAGKKLGFSNRNFPCVSIGFFCYMIFLHQKLSKSVFLTHHNAETNCSSNFSSVYSLLQLGYT